MIRNGLMLLLLTAAIPAQAEWGRLFYSPQERAALDQATVPGGQSVEPTRHYFNGEVQREGSRTLLWVNDQLIRKPPPRHVKPGESWDTGSGQVYPAGRKP